MRLAGLRAPSPWGYGQHYYGTSFAFPYNTGSALAIPTPTAGDGMMHPDVIDFGTAWNGYRYWMAATPYDGNSNTEIPSVVATNSVASGGTWEVPSGYTNPAVADPAGASAHNADPDLIYDSSSGRLYLLYIVTDGSTFEDIRFKYTTGGGTWSSEDVVLSGANNTYTNPSCIKTASGWRLYYTKGTAVTGLFYRDTTTSPVAGYGAEQTCTHPIDLGVMLRQFQNINVVKDTDGTICMVVGDAVHGSGGTRGFLRFSRSTDGGTTFAFTGPPVMMPSDGWDAAGIYRASVLVDANSTVVVDNGMIHVWYSGFTGAGPGAETWGTAWVQLPETVLG